MGKKASVNLSNRGRGATLILKGIGFAYKGRSNADPGAIGIWSWVSGFGRRGSFSCSA